MSASSSTSSTVTATVTEVLPMTGLAYLDGDDHRSWAITKSTTGFGLGLLEPGKRVNLTVVKATDCEFVSEYQSLE